MLDSGTQPTPPTPSILRSVTSLAERGRRIRDGMADAARGPLVIAREVVELADNWENYKAQADGITCSAWLGTVTGNAKRGERYFRARHEAVERIGEHARRTWDHEAAVWASQNIGDCNALAKLNALVLAEYRAKNNQPQCLATVRRLAQEANLYKPRPKSKVCPRCEVMKAALVAAGLPIPE